MHPAVPPAPSALNAFSAPAIVVVEDDPLQREEAVMAFVLAGMPAFGAPNSAVLDQLLETHPVDVVVLDVGLPGENGLSVAARMAQRSPRPGVVMLSAAGSVNDRLAGLGRGADAYLTKPADPRELLATVQAVRRRMAASLAAAASADDGGWAVSVAASTLRHGNQQLRLTALQLQLMRSFSGMGVGEPISRAALMAAVGYDGAYDDPHRLETLLSRLRLRLRAELGVDLPIRTVPGAGYALAAPIVFS